MDYEGTLRPEGGDDQLRVEAAAAAAEAAAARAAALTASEITIVSEPDGRYDGAADGSVEDAPNSDTIDDSTGDHNQAGIISEDDTEPIQYDNEPEDTRRHQHASEPEDTPPPPGDPGEVPPPGDHAETDASGETRSESGLRHIPGLRRDGDENTPVQNKPLRGAVIGAARRGEPQILSITRTQAGGARNVRIEASPSLVPPDAKRPRGDAQPEKEPEFKFWARITAERRTPADDNKQGQQSGGKNETDGMCVEDAIKTYGGKFKLMVVGQGVDSDAQRALAKQVSRDQTRASRTSSRLQDAKKLELVQDQFTKAKDSALVHRSVVIGVETREELEQVARHFAGNGFKSGDTTTWSVETVKEYGPIKEYDSAQAAVEGSFAANDGKGDLNCYITADQFANEVRLPEEEIPGMTVENKEIFATNREVPTDMPSVRIGDIMNDGERGEPLRVTLKDLKRHMLIAASSGSGKTVLMRQIATDVIREDHEASLTPEGAGKPHRAVVIVDFEKIGNYTDEMAAQLSGAGLPPERATVSRIAPGSEGMRANVNLLRLTGTTPSQQVNIATRSLTANITDPQAERVFSKFAGMAISRAYEKLGWNMDTDRSQYPVGMPAIPDMEQVAIAVEEIMNETTFRNETKGDLQGFTQSELEDFLRGIPGQLFTGGYDIDWTKVRENKGITVIELGRITDPEAKRIALTAIMRGMASSLDMENTTGQDTDETKLVMFMDETGGIFDENTAAGRDNAHFFSNLRGKGAAMVIAQQGGINDIHHDVTDSTSNVIGMQMNNPNDHEWIAQRMGVPTTRVLKSVEEGGGLYYGLKMPQGPVQFATIAPKDIPRGTVRHTSDVASLKPGEGNVMDARHLVDRGNDPEFYEGSTKIEARDWLIKDHSGTLLRAAAELGAGLVPMGRDPLEIAGKLKLDLQEMHQGEERKLLECAVVTAITKAVDSRPEIMYNMTRKTLTDYLVKDMMAQIQGTERPERGMFELQVKAGFYSAVKDEIINQTSPKPIPITKPLRAALGRFITGRTANEQLDSLASLEKEALKVVADTVSAATGDPLADTTKAEISLRRLVGKADPDTVIPSIRGRLGSALKKELTQAEIETFDKIVEGIRAGDETPNVGYPDIRSELKKRIDAAKTSQAVDLGDYEELYHEDFSTDARGNELTTSREQLSEIQDRENAMLAKSTQKIDVSNLLFAHDLIEGGLTIDRIVETLIKGNQRQGHVYDRNRREHNAGQVEDLSLVAMFKRADPRAEEWGKRIGIEILRSSNFVMTRATAHFLTRWVSEHVNNLREEAAAFLEQEAAKLNRQTGAK
jgi:hypothetical protein